MQTLVEVFDTVPLCSVLLSGTHLYDVQKLFISNLCRISSNKYLYFVGRYTKILSILFLILKYASRTQKQYTRWIFIGGMLGRRH